MRHPCVVALAGPNGAGKSSVGPALVRDTLQVTQFVNADTIARGLAAFDPDRAAIAAGRVMLMRIKELAARKESFAFETTLASRSFAPWIADLRKDGYVFELIFLWLPQADMAVQRVRRRVQFGGHSVPEDVVRRRYRSGLENFFRLYRPLAKTWRFYDNSYTAPRLIATGETAKPEQISDGMLWGMITKAHERA